MHIVIDVRRQVEVDDMRDVRNIKSTRRNICCDEHGRLAAPEASERHFAFLLRPITVDARGRKTLMAEERFECICASFRLDKDEREAKSGSALFGVCGDEVEEEGSLFVSWHEQHMLRDEFRGRAHASDGHKDVVAHKVCGESLDFLGEGGAEHERLSLSDGWHVSPLDNFPNLRLEAHVEHAIGLVEREVADTRERDSGALDEVCESPGRGHKDVDATLDFAELVLDGRTAVDDHGFDACSVGEFADFVVDLRGEFARRAHDECHWVSSPRSARWAGRRRRLRSHFEHATDDWEGEGGGFARARLRARHEVTSGERDWDGMFLHGRRFGEFASFDVRHHLFGHLRLEFFE